MISPVWITGPVSSGKTTRLVAQFQTWMQADGRSLGLPSARKQGVRSILIVADTSDNRTRLVNQIIGSSPIPGPVQATTPLGFFESELRLFWPLLVESLGLEARFPLRLRPETEQILAAKLWQPHLEADEIALEGVPRERLVRRMLDLLQLAALSGTATEGIPAVLQLGWADLPDGPWEALGEALVQWRDWCLARGLLTYGILSELYWRHLLPNPVYRQHLTRRFWGILADDVDNYPAIARDWFTVLLNQGAIAAFTYNPQGGLRRGLGADPESLAQLSQGAEIIELKAPVIPCLGPELGLTVLEVLERPLVELPAAIQSLRAGSRAQLLRQTAEVILEAIGTAQVQPQEIAILGPGVDAIARYSLTNILGAAGIAVHTLNDQQPLNSFAIVRALLTLLALVHPGCGRLLDPDQVAELLVVLTQAQIDPVRAGLLADHCFAPHPDHPQLLPITVLPRWDRLGYAAATAYETLRSWLSERQQSQQLPPIAVLDQAIQTFLWPQNLTADQLATLRALTETAQHFWQVETYLTPAGQPPPSSVVCQFIQLLRRGAITANPLPVNSDLGPPPAVTLATTFQYRMARLRHRWHFWLDVSSPLWQDGGAVVLWGAPYFWQASSPRAPVTSSTLLPHLLLDLLNRVEERIYLCHSDLAVSGQEQVGPLLPLVDAASTADSQMSLGPAPGIKVH